MHTKRTVLVRKALLIFLLAGLLPSLYFALGGSSAASAQGNKYFSTRTITLQNGESLDEYIINGPPVPPPGYDLERKPVELTKTSLAAGTVTLTVPAYEWSFGCSATSGSMIAAYWDRTGFPNMYTGPTNGGVMPLDSSPWPDWTDEIGDTYAQCPLIASHDGLDGRSTRGSIDDYWVSYLSNARDPYLTNGWTQHTWGDAIGDYMKTSQSAYGNVDGSTNFWNYTSSASPLTCSQMETLKSQGKYISTLDGTYGRKLFYEARGYTVTDCYNKVTDNIFTGGFSFVQYKAEINAGRPVFLNLAGHSVVGVGYDDSTNTVYLHDTWDYNMHTMTWGGSYSGMELRSVSIVNLAVPVTYTISGNAGVADATLTYTGGSTTADGTGAYSFSVSSGWSGTVTPSKTGYTFDPASRSYSNVTANQTNQDYTAALITYTISGNAGAPSVTMDYTGGTTTANSIGDYSFSVNYGWSGTVTPSRQNFTFDPADRTYTNVTEDQIDQDFTATYWQSLPLVTGWNLVSFNVHPANTSITSVLASISGQYSLVYAWDATSASWLIYDPTLGDLNDMKTLDESMGFWIKMNSDQALAVGGNVAGSTSIDLKSGWNLVGFPSAANGPLPAILSDHGVGSDFSLVYAYHASELSAAWKLFDRLGNPLLNDLTELASGWGYWVKASAAHTWTVP